jgi:ferredoxin-like protein FixX
VGVKISFAGVPNETTLLCDYATPTHHYLESWGDAEPKRGHYSLIQPAMAPIFATVGRPGTRQAEESLLRWAALVPEAEAAEVDEADDKPFYHEKVKAKVSTVYYDYLKAHWQERLFPQQSSYATFQMFWDSALHDGVFETPPREYSVNPQVDAAAAAAKISKPANSELEISFFETVNVGAGQYANNPWLQELPDPVSRTSWGNYLAIPVSWDGGNEWKGFKNLNKDEIKGKADIVEVEINGLTHRATCVRQFGQPGWGVAMALGYGRQTVSQAGKNVGVNVFPWLSIDANGNTQYYATNASVSDKVAEEKQFACVQYHHTMGVTGADPKNNETINVDEKTVMTLGAGYQGGLTDRSIIYQDNLKDVQELVEHIKEKRHEAQKLNSHTLYPFEKYSEDLYSQGHHWGMHVDLNACIGCGACQVACTPKTTCPWSAKKRWRATTKCTGCASTATSSAIMKTPTWFTSR